ncbi:MAG TPA: hypothetical protein VFD72_01050 [Sphingobacteriaceae bacterium]|nr:hypothetical protein [Sphingobacteriaceae bacterium]
MKRLFVLTLVLLMGLGSFSWANTVVESDDLMNNPELSFQINLGDIGDKSEVELEHEIAHYLESVIPLDQADLQCKVTVTGELNVGSVSLKISVEVSGDCATMAKSGRTIATMVLNEVKNEIKKIF